MDFAEFDVLAEPLQRRSAESKARHGFALIDGRTSTPEVIAYVEDRMGVIFPDKYKVFMTRYGGGVFGFVELLPLVEPDKPATYGDVWAENDRFFPERDFVAVAEVGTDDYWVSRSPTGAVASRSGFISTTRTITRWPRTFWNSSPNTG